MTVETSRGGGQADREALFWESIKASQDAGDFEAYLQQFPKGTFAPLAKNRLEKLKGKSIMVAGGDPPKEEKPEPKLEAMDRGEFFILWGGLSGGTGFLG